MEEIKLLIIVLLTICSYLKLRSGQKKAQSLFKISEKDEEENIKSEPKRMEEEIDEAECSNQPYLIRESAIDEFIRIDQKLFPKHIPKPSQCKDRYRMIGEQDCNDVFGDQYRKCIRGKVLDMEDKTVIYNNQYYLNRVFANSYQNQFYDHGQHLKAIQHLLAPKYPLPQFRQNDSPGSLSNRGKQMGNTYNNFSFNINFDQEPMQAEDFDRNGRIEEEQFESEHPEHKKKGIFKRPKLVLKRNNHNQSAKEPDVAPWLKNKKKTVICLQDEIKKKEHELQMLRRLHRTKTK